MNLLLRPAADTAIADEVLSMVCSMGPACTCSLIASMPTRSMGARAEAHDVGDWRRKGGPMAIGMLIESDTSALAA